VKKGWKYRGRKVGRRGDPHGLIYHEEFGKS
jgi:hypothetical protein